MCENEGEFFVSVIENEQVAGSYGRKARKLYMMFKLPFVVQVQAIYYFITVLGKNILYCYINIHPQTLKDIN